MSPAIAKTIKWILYFSGVLIAGLVITIAVIFSTFEDAKTKADEACDSFSLDETYLSALKKAQKYDYALEALSGNVDNKTEITMLFTGDLVGWAGCSLEFEGERLIRKNVWVD